MLNSDKHRSNLAFEEKNLIREFELQETLANVVFTVGSPASRPWTDADWSCKLERYAALGCEWDSCGADASEAKVLIVD